MGGVLLAGTLLVPASVAAPTWVGPVAPLDSSSQPPGPTHVAFGPDGDALAVWTNTTGTTGYIR
jgi:hypothetical protein